MLAKKILNSSIKSLVEESLKPSSLREMAQLDMVRWVKKETLQVAKLERVITSKGTTVKLTVNLPARNEIIEEQF